MRKERKLSDAAMLRRELDAIAGKPNFSVGIGTTDDGKNTTAHCWWVTRKGRRAGDRQCLLVLADKARDLGLEVGFALKLSIDYQTDLFGFPTTNIDSIQMVPCSQDHADMVCVWIPN